MSMVEQIAENAKALPEPLPTEALHFVDYLATIAKTTVIRRLGRVSEKDLNAVQAALDELFRVILTS